jgi:hypothetical protein
MSLSAGLIFLSSYNNQSSETSTDFSLTLSVPVTKGKKLRLLAATLPNLFMPFAANDSRWTFKINGVNYTMYFPTDRRWATIADFTSFVYTTMFTAAVNDLGVVAPVPATVTLNYDANKNQLYLASSVVGTTFTMPGWAWNNYQGTSISYNANYRLGWTSDNAITGTNTLYADGFPNVFQRTNVVYMATNIAAGSNNDNNIANIIGRIPINMSWGGVVNYENVHTDFKTETFSANFKEVKVQLLDEDYQALNQPNNAYFSFTIGIEYDLDDKGR